MKPSFAFSLVLTIFYIIVMASCSATEVIRLLFFIPYPFYLSGLLGIKLRSFFMKMLTCLPFILGIILLQLFTGNSQTAYIMGMAIKVKYVISISLMIKSILTTGCVLILIDGFSFYEIACGLHTLRLPITLVDTILILIRFLDLIIDEVKRINTARMLRVRGFNLTVARGMLLSLFNSCIDRGNMVGNAWMLRGMSDKDIYMCSGIGFKDVLIGSLFTLWFIVVRLI